MKWGADAQALEENPVAGGICTEDKSRRYGLHSANDHEIQSIFRIDALHPVRMARCIKTESQFVMRSD